MHIQKQAPEHLVSLKRCSIILGLKDSWLRKFVRRKSVPIFPVSRHLILVRVSDVLAAIEALRVGGVDDRH
jgi:hypothetical protein